MARERSGLIVERNGKFYARITYVGNDGKRHEKWRVAKNRTQARELKKQLLRDLDSGGEEIFKGESLTFTDLAQYYEERYLKPAEYREGRKIAGLRSVRYCELYLRTLKEYFGNRKLRSITYGDLEAFKLQRLSKLRKERALLRSRDKLKDAFGCQPIKVARDQRDEFFH